MNKGDRIYLACPFSSQQPHSQKWEDVRFRQVNIAAMALINAGYVVFSPISHSHPISSVQPSLMNTHELWLKQDVEFLHWADFVVVLTLPGWSESYGVAWEIKWAKENCTPILYVTMDDIYRVEGGGRLNEKVDQD